MLLALAALFLIIHPAEGEIRIAGSSTVAPILADGALEEGLSDIVVRPTGTVRGIQELCTERSVDMIGASRKIGPDELAACAEAGLPELAELMIGIDGIVLAQNHRRPGFAVDLVDLYLAAAARVPVGDRCVLVPNPNTNWRDIDPALPDRPVRIFGPPATSGTRDVFVELALAEGARQLDCLAELERQDPEAFARAISPRHDDVWLDAGENDAAIAAALLYVDDAIGIFGLDSFGRVAGLEALRLEGVLPSAGSVSTGAYPLSRPLYVYMTPEAIGEPSVKRLVTRLQAPGDGRKARLYSTSDAEARVVNIGAIVPGSQ